ncbi:MAG TPA: hypothetical protein DCE80_01910 [Ignavibacteriales bacterium]|nr:hypothetical protein [Ignavibacteriales bacterium]
MDYPDNCIRGLSKGCEITVEGFAPEHAFYFDNVQRKDGWDEQSINWEDDESVIRFTLNQKKENGDIKYVNGVAVISRYNIDRLIDRMAKGLLRYERKRIDGNRYHGNILLKSGTSKKTMKIIAAGISLSVEKIVPSTST